MKNNIMPVIAKKLGLETNKNYVIDEILTILAELPDDTVLVSDEDLESAPDIKVIKIEN